MFSPKFKKTIPYCPASYKTTHDLKIFDWVKAAQLIRASGCANALAGFLEDWDISATPIFGDGEMLFNPMAHANSKYATPAIEINGQKTPCWILGSYADYDADEVWPDDAVEVILRK